MNKSNMDFQFENELCCIKHCWGVYEQNNIVNSVGVNDGKAEWSIIAGNGTSTR